MSLTGILIGSLATWRLTHLLAAEDGPGDLLVRLRRRLGEGFWGRLLDCFLCLSVWIALPFALVLGDDAGERLLLWPALSAAAILLQRATSPAAPYFEEAIEPETIERKELDDELLRQRTDASDSGDDPTAGPAE